MTISKILEEPTENDWKALLNLDKIMESEGEGNGEGDEEGNGDKITVRINGKGDVEVRLPNHDTWKEFDDLFPRQILYCYQQENFDHRSYYVPRRTDG